LRQTRNSAEPTASRLRVPEESVRREWLESVIREIQAIAVNVLLVEPDDTKGTLAAFVESLPRPATYVEKLLLRGLLSDVAGRCGEAVHRRWHRGRALTTCPFVPAASLVIVWNTTAHDPTHSFLLWIDHFFHDFFAAHPATAAATTAGLLRSDYTRNWDLATLARRVHVTPSKLRRDFHQQFGMSPLEYQRTVRLQHALRELPGAKVDAIALQVGYRSKKDFYSAFKQLTGITLTAFRSLSRERAAVVVDSVRLRHHRLSDLP
jgi:AraC-like DNA-binding protein